MNTIPALPTTPLAVRTVEYVRACETESVANHSIRSYLFAELLAVHEGLRPSVDFDADLLFFACVLHDLGTSPAASGNQRFEVDGADLGAAFLTDNGVDTRRVDLVWEAIALHSSSGIAERRGTLAYLTRKGVALDFGAGSEFVTDTQADALHSGYPRLQMVTSLVDEIVRHAARSPHNAPRYTIAGELVRERDQDGHATTLEQAALTSRWGE
ncbi:MAG TPA: HD domain-containing protein [Cellulomonas sp.]|uniref:HD domain-containing protein n=1 Tax=Cellulomonas sp. TaxID=40001 RepID=UPI002E355915|nr:HD domain-containing protein [Cellulomonas sp.]HEX5334138.1 HD domain-containing protein [Cellulomonas sp.]